MADGIWTGNVAGENLRQSNLTRHRILTFSTGQDLAASWEPESASGLGSLDPNSIAPNTRNSVTPRGAEGGPHFVMSGETTDGSPHTYGFEWMLFVDGISLGHRANADTGGYTVTIWELIAVTQNPAGDNQPVWGSFDPQTGVNVRELYNSFDVNATCLRWQIENLEDDPTTDNKVISLAFAEL